ncbi:hypothetical protein SARC_13871 [Sphaeroforma arctica JP610]|uniref:Uncharacterized protein n=1 Tax=Sphaeroforma arctica JP610 TaxID=667725 RepID=A0A0L0FAQ0_9EUKA|nr:hypothetical protein SARC_13871 [Sphaeroforma arctica JP610]KNC73571.1 hypothetical protein SARC_13871 [Sphaeroforma arctica JP610]|eukprot:XP_014147473.1 hypothetical protein SARC_13871 [Sphaeroforma arctica JP610]
MRKRCTNGMRLGLAHEFQHRYDLAIQQYNIVKEWIREGFTLLKSEHGSAPPVKYEALAETNGDTTIASSAIESAPLDTCKSNVPVSAADKAGRVAPPAEAATEAPDDVLQ